jgi:hypothetical protein
MKMLGFLAVLTFLLLPQGAGATISLVQHTFTTTGCGGTSCAIALSATGSGHLLVATATNGASSGFSITSVSGAGTWTHCPACVSADSGGGSTDISYNLSSTSGVTTITVNFSPSNGFESVAIDEYSFTASSIAVDNYGVLDQTSAGTSIAGVALTLSGSNDVIIQTVAPSGACSAVSGSYTNPVDFEDGSGVAGSINTTSGSAPNWTCTSSTAALSAIAFTESGGTPRPTPASRPR